MDILAKCEAVLPDQMMISRVAQVKCEVLNAWTNIKWSHIILALDGKKEIDPEIEKDYISSIELTI